MSKKSRFTEEQIMRALKEVDAGGKVDELCRRLGVTQTTFYRWKSKFGGMEVSDARRLKQLEDENRRLKQMVADLSLDLQQRRCCCEKNGEARGVPLSRGPRDEGIRSQLAPRLSRPRLNRSSWH